MARVMTTVLLVGGKYDCRGIMAHPINRVPHKEVLFCSDSNFHTGKDRSVSVTASLDLSEN